MRRRVDIRRRPAPTPVALTPCSDILAGIRSPVPGRPERMGEVVEIPTAGKAARTIRAKIVSPVFYDPDGEKQNV